jgi:pimeloyl-ACP methyl ester carboxylesterase
MATYVLIPGAGSGPWYWHLVEPELRRRGHDVVAVELPCEDGSAGLLDYVDVVVDAIGDRSDRGDGLVVVGQSMGGLTAPLVCDRVPVDLLVLVAAMVPAPGETGGDWWANTGQGDAMRAMAERDGRGPGFDEVEMFLHDVPEDLIRQAEAHHHDQSDAPFATPWPRHSWPDVPTRFLLCRDDRFFPAEFQRRVVAERLGIVPDEIDGGHLPMLSRPKQLAEYLLDCWSSVGTTNPTAPTAHSGHPATR